jgi:hypothetical protein
VLEGVKDITPRVQTQSIFCNFKKSLKYGKKDQQGKAAFNERENACNTSDFRTASRRT